MENQMNLRALFSLCLLAFSSILSGCTLQTTATPNVIPGTSISGTAHGGQQAILNAKVYLLTLNPNNYAGPGITATVNNGSISLLNPASTGNAVDSVGSYVLTNNTTGGFNVHQDYSCTVGYQQGSSSASVTLPGTEQVYLYVVGGTGSQSTLTNPASGLLVALGPCNNPTTQVTVNEVTTVATAYAFAGFATDATHMGSYGTTLANTGLANAFTNVGNLVNTSTGAPTSTTISGNGTTPTATMISIADILAACVNSNGSMASGSSCATLFQYTASAGATGTAPTDTATAAINLAHNFYPTVTGVTALFGLIPAVGAPFVGGLSAAPQSFLLPITYTGANIRNPQYAAIDGSGNFWVTNDSTGSGVISEITPTGSYPFGTSGTTFNGTLSGPNSIAFDVSGNAWVTNANSANFSTRTPSGVTGTVPQTTCSTSSALAFDGIGNLWSASAAPNQAICKYSVSGTSATQTVGGLISSNMSSLARIAFDSGANAWIGANTALVQVSSSGTFTSYNIGLSNTAVAFDDYRGLWMASDSVNGRFLYQVTSSGTVSYTHYGGGLNVNYAMAIDSAGTIWLPNYFNGLTPATGVGVSVFDNYGDAISPNAGFTAGSLDGPHDLVIDGSGNVWIPSYSNSTITEYIGAASPVVTPMAANLAPPYYKPASRP
jgi:hypothetical protein